MFYETWEASKRCSVSGIFYVLSVQEKLGSLVQGNLLHSREVMIQNPGHRSS